MKRIISLIIASAILLSGTQAFAIMKQNIEFFSTKQRSWDIQVDESIIYLADGNAGVQIIDSTDKDNLIHLANINLGVDVRTVEKKGDVLYVCGGGKMFVYNVKNPADAFLMKTDIVQENASRVNIDGNLMGVFGGTSATIFNVADKASPVKVATIGGIGNMLDGYLKDKYVYVISRNTLYIYDISDFSDVKMTASLVMDTIDYAPDIIVEDDYLYIADDTVFATVDVSDKAKPQVVLSEDYSSARPNALFVEDEKLYVGGYNSQLMVFDLPLPEKPVKIDDCSTNSAVYSIAKEGEYIYAAGMGGAYIIDPNYVFDKTKLPKFLSENEVFGEEQAIVKPESPFDDTNGHWAEEYIAQMSDLGYILGKENNKFAPEDNITRAEFIAIAVRMATPALERYKYRFSDVDDWAWYSDYIETANALGIIPEEMIENKKLLPDEKITREEMAAVTVNLMEYIGITTTQITELDFEDNADIAEWSKQHVNYAYSLGLINGMDNNRFEPKSPSTRAQVCKILASAYEMTLDSDAEFISKTYYRPEDNTTVDFTKPYSVDKNSDGRPVIINVTDAVEPGDLIVFYGENLTSPEIYLEEGASENAEPSENAIKLEIVQKDNAGQCITSAIPQEFNSGVFTAYIKNSVGYSNPIPVNMARLTWVDREIAQKDDIIRVNGRNLAAKEFGGELKTSVALVNDKNTYNLSLNSINPFMVEAYIDESVENGEYDVYVSNDGERWVTSNETYGKIIVKDKTYDPYNLNQPWADEFNWDNKIDVTKAPYNADKTGVADSTEAIQKAIDDAHNAGGGVVYLPEGEYKNIGIQMDSKVVLIGDGMEKSKLIYAYKGDDISSKQMIGTKGAGKIDGRIGFMNLGISLDDEPMQGFPDTFLWLGEDWGSNIDNTSIRTAQYIFIKGCKLWSPMIKPSHSKGRGLGVVCVSKGNTLFENNIFYGNQMSVTSSYMGKYCHLLNNHFTTTVNNVSMVATHTTGIGNTMNRNWEYGTEVVATQGIFMRGYTYIAENTIRNTGMPGANDGELLCAETYRAGTRMSGKVVSADSSSITVNPLRKADGSLLSYATGGWSLNAAYGDKWDIIITSGKGIGQRRRVLSLDEASETFFIEGEWDIIPDSTSEFVFAIASYSVTFYNNYANTGAKGLWFYGDCMDCVVSENNLIDTEGVYIYSCHNANIGRTNIAYFNRLSKNVSKGFGSKSGLNGIGVQAGVEFAAPTSVPIYGVSITNNLIVGGDVLPEQSQVTEAPPINGIYAVNDQRTKASNSNTVMKGVIIQDNRVEKLDRGISIGNANYIDLNKSGQNVIGTMTENIVLKGNTFSEVQNEIIDFRNEGTYVD